MNLTMIPSTIYNISNLTSVTTRKITESPRKLIINYLKESDVDFELSLVKSLLRERRKHSHHILYKAMKEARHDLEKEVVELYSLLSTSQQSFWFWRRFWYDDKLIKQYRTVQTLHTVMNRRLQLFNSITTPP